ncbi:MAG TPA: protein TolQ [Gammaproteobacteria bacterium]|jgi:biopolymer transport protein TolQ|nr:protein TolQ [Gammaproteobacteria bacterium]MDA0826433.1 protein TolQ [Pseudomonadota bacterium]MDA7591960.1 protein TolQ [Pseudomonadales bacterium]MDG2403438.1 protein TolQ [Paracoccaceae bacterium]MBT5009392.1 protein TolQ [Gammaproteobacteria bacterium]
MNEPISILELVLNASIVVQLVMAILVMASLVSWVLIFQRAFLLSSVKRLATNFENEFWSGQDLRAIFLEIENSETEIIGIEHLFQAGFKEFTRSKQQYGNQAERIMQNVQRAMRVALAREEERLEGALAFLATVGSTSPYIGLFGTVWGIMNSFRGLAMSNQASLSVVAPGISEALIATAIGLFAAIPAVIAYNRYSAQVEVMMNRFETFSDEFSAILNRSIADS